jgi:hypothetical protein
VNGRWWLLGFLLIVGPFFGCASGEKAADDRDDVVAPWLPVSELAPSQRYLRVVEHRRK